MSLRIRLAILGFWLGVLTFFSLVVAPAAFKVLPTQQLAGSMVSRSLSAVEYIGIAVGLVLIAIVALTRPHKRKLRLAEIVLLALMTASMVLSHYVVSARLHEMRIEHGESLASLPPTDSTRASFDMLHQMSVGLTGFNLAGTVLLILVLIWQRRGAGIEAKDRSRDV